MNNGGPAVVLVTIFTMMAAAFVSVSVLMGNGNELGNMLYYVMIGGGIVGAIAPRLSLSLLIVELTLLDLIKRMLVFAGTVAQPDLFWVLGVAPVTMAGIFVGTLLRVLMDENYRRPGDLTRLMLVAVLNVLLCAVSLANGGGIGGTLREMANSSLYSTLIFVVPVLLRDTPSLIRALRLILMIFIPVALYGVYQAVFGFQEFEIEYLKRGLSIEIKQLMNDRVRPFSTLNSPTALGSICGMFTAFCFFMAGKASGTGRSIFSPFVALLLGLCYTLGLVASTSRTDYLMLPVIGIAIWAFPSPKRTTIVYICSVVGFIGLVIASPWMLENLGTWNTIIGNMTGSSSSASAMMSVGTYFDRLNGFSNVLMNPAAWTVLGMGEERISVDFASHDPISYLLVRFGIVGLGIAIVVAVFALRILGLQVSSVESPYGRKLCAAVMGMAFGVAVTSVLSGSRMTVFPVNTLVWFFLASIPVIADHDRRLRIQRQAEAETEADTEIEGENEQPLPLQTAPRLGFHPTPHRTA